MTGMRSSLAPQGTGLLPRLDDAPQAAGPPPYLRSPVLRGPRHLHIEHG
ncbi:hypothetical protein [Streptomyces sp. NPDC017993]